MQLTAIKQRAFSTLNGINIATADGSNDRPRYQAAGKDDAGNSYTVTWAPYDNYQERMAEDDESACCDWDVYTVAAV